MSFSDAESGTRLSAAAERRFRRDHGERVRAWLADQCDEINKKLSWVEQVHLDTPNPALRPEYVPDEFLEGPPMPPAPARFSLGVRLLAKLLPAFRERVLREGLRAEAEYREAVAGFERRRSEHQEKERARRVFIEEEIVSNDDAMAEFLEEQLSAMEWPRETLISHDIREAGSLVIADIDLPEIEDLPTRTATVASRGLKLSIKELSPARLRQLYVRHVHGVLFRVIGGIFASLPTCKEVVASGFSQRRDPATGHEREEYLLSVRVQRTGWEGLNFDSLESVDVAGALAEFELRREIARDGSLSAVSPIV